MGVTDRGQAHTLEAFSAAVVLLASVLFALQVTVVTPLSASTASQHVENQQSGVAASVLDGAAENGTLKQTVLFWNDSSGTFHNVSENGLYALGGPPTNLGRELNETFLDRGIAFELTFKYINDDRLSSEEVVDLGTPSDNAVTVRRTVTLFEDDHLYHANGTKSDTKLKDANVFYATDESGHHGLYNVIIVELTVWRM